MKKLTILCAALMAVGTLAAQNDATTTSSLIKGGTWATSSSPALKFSEMFYDNWSATGNSQITLHATFFGNYKYTHSRYVWDNIVDLAYGYSWQDLDNSAHGEGGFFESRRKSADKIDITSALSWKAYKDWGASFTANLKTQFGPGYEYASAGDNEGRMVSSFMAPGYLTTALSFELKKPDWSVSVSFLTGKTTFVCKDDLLDSGYTYGVIQDDDFYTTDALGNEILNPDRKHTHAYFALGSYVKAQYLKKDILPNLDLYARVELFYDYKKPSNMAWGSADEMKKDSKYTLAENETWEQMAAKNWLEKRAFETDVDAELKLDYRFSKHIAANFALNLKYDTDFAGRGKWKVWQLYQLAGIQVFFDWKTPKAN